ncbi:uncharacterized protein L3040_005185 [Drepanopeziza brunnea f. sp. 'multigermtubi']|uniref:uncharacterized protein n=1 Tax=Drepanopeziza brunnea f. sp. 'multigermtubi' TaxID=698441 RepID=UPI00239AC0BB|nr:hypothetical protein L3040_005185 [Drepanopeziza brunnea f. sp. 'multigermtubi']
MLSRTGFVGSRWRSAPVLSTGSLTRHNNSSLHFGRRRQAPGYHNQYGQPRGIYATFMAASMGLIWVTFQEEIPVVGGKQFNIIPHEWMLRHEAEWDIHVKHIHAIVNKIAPQEPGILWPEDHPTSMVVRKIWIRLLEASGYDPSLWKLHIVNAPSIAACVASLDRQVVVYSGSLHAAYDEAGMAMMLSGAIARVTMNSLAVDASHFYFEKAAVLPVVQLIVTSFFLKRLWFVALPYSYLYFAVMKRRLSLDVMAKDFNDCTYISLEAMCRAGYDLTDALNFAVNNYYTSRDLLAELEEEAERGTVDQGYVDAIRESNYLDQLRVMKMHHMIPEITKKVGSDRMERQEPKLLPTEVYEHPGDIQPTVSWD